MRARLEVPPLGWVAKLADTAMIPLMYLLSGTLRESPQCTHKWNNLKISNGMLDKFDKNLMVHANLSPNSMKSHYGFLFHVPILGGWREYVVIEPIVNENWYIGWISGLVGGVSRINLFGPTRVLRGPSDTLFFGINAETGEQLPLRQIGSGCTGDRGQFSRIRLL